MSEIGIPDAAIQAELDKNDFQDPTIIDGPTQLYRHWDKDGNLLYVGISLSAIERLREHRARSSWFYQIACITVTTYETRHKAETAEDLAIVLEKPLHNVFIPAAPDYDVFDPEEAKVEKARMVQKLRASLEKTKQARRKKLKAEIEAAGMESAL